MVTKYSKLKLISELMKRNLWSQAKDWMQNNGGYYDLFMAAQYLSSDHPTFAEILGKIQAELGISGDLASEILEASVLDEDAAV